MVGLGGQAKCLFRRLTVVSGERVSGSTIRYKPPDPDPVDGVKGVDLDEIPLFLPCVSLGKD